MKSAFTSEDRARLDRIEAKLDALLLALADDGDEEPRAIDWEGNEVPAERDQFQSLDG